MNILTEKGNMSSDLVLTLIQEFLRSSRSCVDALLKELSTFSLNQRGKVTLFTIDKNRRKEVKWDGKHLFLRASTEYSNPQLTLEETQGIIAARLLEACGNYLEGREGGRLNRKDIAEISESLRKPPSGKIVPFLLNTDDVEPDRYSINPLRESIVRSGQSAFPAASVTTDELEIDNKFSSKYEGALISRGEVDSIKLHLKSLPNRYVDFIDVVKHEELKRLSEVLGIDLCIPTLRMPLEMLMKEKPGEPLHIVIQESHSHYKAIKTIYELMGRSIKRRALLLTVPHSEKGFGSKRSAKGKIAFRGNQLERIHVRYQTMPLYPNMVDPGDVSVAKADDYVSVEAERVMDYDYSRTPSSPQFALYATLSPEDAALWHGVGKFAGSEVVRSYASIRLAFSRNIILKGVPHFLRPGAGTSLQFNLAPEKMWAHPRYGNIDTSVGCIQNLESLVRTGIKVEILSIKERYSHIT